MLSSKEIWIATTKEDMIRSENSCGMKMMGTTLLKEDFIRNKWSINIGKLNHNTVYRCVKD